MTKKQTPNDVIDLVDLMNVLRANVLWIILFAVLGGAAGYGVSTYLMHPIYEASINMIVNTRQDTNTTVTNDNITSAQNLVDTYAVIIKSNTVLNQVIDELSLEKTYDGLNSEVSVASVNSTQVMKVAVRDRSAHQARQIVQKISEVAPDIIVDAVEAGSCKVVSDVYYSNNQVYPDVRRNTMKAAMLGICLSVGFFIVRYLLDNTFRSELDIQNELGIPVLGVLPSVESCIKNGSGRKRREK